MPDKISHDVRDVKDGGASRAEREWNAEAYEELADPMTRWGAAFLGRLELAGDEVVVDAGCGTGRVTELLLRRLPRGRVIAVDASQTMVEAARRRFAGDSRVRVVRQDLLRLEVEEPVDVVFSTATFHWIPDHAALFRRLAAALRPGGRLAAQCGGDGNVSRVREATRRVMGEERFAPFFEGWEDNKLYADAGGTRRRLEEAGFERVETWLHEEPTTFRSVEHLTRYLEAIILRGHLLRLPEAERRPFARAVAEKIAAHDGPLLVDYVRLNMLAVRAGE
ncbi:Trans-aconitate 2-methyltransferase [Rubrobacter xylanophilus DSM 9941]|nr:Trans-aconitate 2-methyltransferase [Rubrobacter xylanophilus DSM 9941]